MNTQTSGLLTRADYSDYLNRFLGLANEAETLKAEAQRSQDEAQKLQVAFNAHKGVFRDYPDYASILVKDLGNWKAYTDKALHGLKDRLKKEGKQMFHCLETVNSSLPLANTVLADFPNVQKTLPVRLKAIKYGQNIGEIDTAFSGFQALMKDVKRLEKIMGEVKPGVSQANTILADFPRLQKEVLHEHFQAVQYGQSISDIENHFSIFQAFMQDVRRLAPSMEHFQSRWQSSELKQFMGFFVKIRDSIQKSLEKAKSWKDIKASLDDLENLCQRLEYYQKVIPSFDTLKTLLADLSQRAKSLNLQQAVTDEARVLQQLAESVDEIALVNQLEIWHKRALGKIAAVNAAQSRGVKYMDCDYGHWVLDLFLFFLITLPVNLCIGLYSLWISLTRESSVSEVLERSLSDF